MTNLFNKFKDFVGLSESDDESDDGYETDYPNNKWQQYQNSDEEEEVEPTKPEPTPYRRPRDTMNFITEPSLGTNRSNVIGMPGINGNAEVVVIEAHSFEEMPQIIQTLKKGKSVVLNLNVMDPDEAQRAVDFVAGGTFAIDGHQQRIGESIFLFTPSCVKVSTLEGVLNDAAETSKANVRTTSSWGADVNRIAQ